MYESFFGFRERPFAAGPMAKRYFPGAAIEAARQAAARCIERAEGVAMIVGPAGTGKSLLCQVLADEFRGQLEVALLTSGRLGNRRGLLQAILFELGLPYRGRDEGDLRLALIDHLAPRTGSTTPTSEGLLLIVDEAHTLPYRLMEELRLITNLARNGLPRVRLVLVGGPQLEERFASPRLESFNQRVAVRAYLELLDRAETIKYVKHQICQVGGDPASVLADEALTTIHAATDGIPRLINQLCDHALLLAYAGGVRQLSTAAIEEAWADLQQLPTPWSSAEGAAAPTDSADVIEFGRLEDESPEELPAAVPFPKKASPQAALTVDTREAECERAVEWAGSDDDFQPAGSIMPEVELAFQSLSTPFHSFDEEEVVLDRYTSIERDALANRPLVRGPESRELGALLPPAIHPSGTQPPQIVGLSNATWPGGIPTSLANEPLDSTEQFASHAHSLPELAEPLSTIPNTAPLPAAAAPITPELATGSMLPIPTPASDDDLIVIEEPVGFAAESPNIPRPKVRRQEYRQLFAQLRQS